MKICLLTDKYPPDPGGLAVSARRLARGLAAAGHTVHVCAPRDDLAPGQIAQTEADGVMIHRLGAHRRSDDTQADWFDLAARLHHQIYFDLLHGYYIAGAGLVTVYAGRYLDLPTIVSARGNDLDRAVFNPGSIGAIAWALTHAGAVTTVSLDLARKARALAPTCQPQVIANGVDTTHFIPLPPEPTCRARYGLTEATPIIGFVGEARLKKGLTILLPALALVARHLAKSGQPAPTLFLIGGIRPNEADILDVFRAKQPHLTVQVVPYTNPDQLPSLYGLLDILVLPSLRDGLPNALLEGMACERAVIASNIGGIPEVIRPGENGLLVSPGDVDGLAQAVMALLLAPNRRASLGRAARQTVLQHFTPAGELQANLALYHHLKA